jgi:2-keto-4-pentenoate hydratase/2-oxohepta-3-ene-1,7-dioic acid hydratase in catechol pathway
MKLHRLSPVIPALCRLGARSLAPWWSCRFSERICPDRTSFLGSRWYRSVARPWAIRVLGPASLGALTLIAGSGLGVAQTQLEPAAERPRVIRYISALPEHQGETCYGLVLVEANGIPVRVRALSDRHPQLCHKGSPGHGQPQLLRWAFKAADAVTSAGAETHTDEGLAEDLNQERLADLVLPPIEITGPELDSLQRFVIGVGLNYAEHREEVGGEEEDTELLVFPKPVAPTGPYAPVRPGVQLGELPVRPVLLLDYEVELGLVLLEDLDLRHLPGSYEAFIEQVAFFTANDVSDREPIILDEEAGYTRGKSHPTYLPIGPWMVHGRHLRPRTRNEGEDSLEIGAAVSQLRPADEPSVGEMPFGEERQLSTTDAMLRGPWAIVRLLSEMFRRGDIVCMRDANGHPRFIHDGDGVIPAGSIILTGTPGGTAIREPRLVEKAGLFVRGGLSVQGARKAFIEDLEQDIAGSPYLEIGDKVESWVESLGRQRWSVEADAERRPHGVDTNGACEPGTRPQPIPQP